MARLVLSSRRRHPALGLSPGDRVALEIGPGGAVEIYDLETSEPLPDAAPLLTAWLFALRRRQPFELISFEGGGE